MALRIGKKTTPAAPTTDAPVDTPVSDVPDDFGEFSNIPSDNSDSPFQDTKTVGGGKSPKKKPPKALLGGLAALLVVAIAGGAFFVMKGSPPPDDTAPLPVPVRPKKPGAPGAPGTPGAAKPGAAVVPGKPDAVPAVGAAKPGVPATKPGAPAKPGPAAPGAKTPGAPATGAPAPAGAPAAAGAAAAGKQGAGKSGVKSAPTAAAAPTVAPTPKAITNVIHEPPASGLPGKTDPANAVRVVHKQLQPNSALLLQLKQCWAEGKAAKINKNYAAARTAWEKGLKLAGTNPDAAASAKGFQESLAKLPKK